MIIMITHSYPWIMNMSLNPVIDVWLYSVIYDVLSQCVLKIRFSSEQNSGFAPKCQFMLRCLKTLPCSAVSL